MCQKRLPRTCTDILTPHTTGTDRSVADGAPPVLSCVNSKSKRQEDSTCNERNENVSGMPSSDIGKPRHEGQKLTMALGPKNTKSWTPEQRSRPTSAGLPPNPCTDATLLENAAAAGYQGRCRATVKEASPSVRQLRQISLHEPVGVAPAAPRQKR